MTAQVRAAQRGPTGSEGDGVLCSRLRVPCLRGDPDAQLTRSSPTSLSKEIFHTCLSWSRSQAEPLQR